MGVSTVPLHRMVEFKNINNFRVFVLEAAETAGRAASEEVEDIADRFAWLRQRSRRYEEQDDYGSHPGEQSGDDDDVEQAASGPSSHRVERMLRGVIGYLA